MRPTKIRKSWRNHEPGRPGFSEEKIIRALEIKPQTVKELTETTKLAMDTVIERLFELEKKGLIERKVEPPIRRGRGMRNRVVIKLSEKASNPVEVAIRHISAVREIDADRCRELLTENTVQAVLEIASLSYDRPSRKWNVDPIKKFNESILLRALARFHFEALAVPHIIKDNVSLDDTDDPIDRMLMQNFEQPELALKTIYENYAGDPAAFPAQGLARKRNAEARLMGLLHAIFTRDKKTGGVDVDELIFPDLVTSYFADAKTEYAKYHLIPCWRDLLGSKNSRVIK